MFKIKICSICFDFARFLRVSALLFPESSTILLFVLSMLSCVPLVASVLRPSAVCPLPLTL